MASSTSRHGRGIIPGRKLVIQRGIQAFVPNPLPGHFTWDNRLVGILSKADQALGRLEGLGRKLPDPSLLVRMFLRREAELSSRIEQTYARVQTMLLFDHLPDVAQKVPAVREVTNNFRVLESAFQVKQPVSLSLIRRMHEMLFEGIDAPRLAPGNFRRIQNWIGHTHRIEDARYIPPPPQEVERCMRGLVEYIRTADDLPTLVRCAMAHYQFEAIHPFADGNGRIGRAIVLLMLKLEKALPVPLLNPSAQLEQNRREYYDLLLNVTRRGEWKPWIEFFASSVAQEAEDACHRLTELDALRDGYRAQFGTARTSALLMRLIDELFADPAITAQQAASALQINAATAQRLVDKLAHGNVLREVTGKRRNRVYVAQSIVDLFSTRDRD
jgi:Fic family protein